MNNKAWYLIIAFSLSMLVYSLLNVNWGTGNTHKYGYFKGSDFYYFHNGGRLIRTGEAYDRKIFSYHMNNDYGKVTQKSTWGALHPPIMFYLYAPLAKLELIPAMNIAIISLFLLYILTGWLLYKYRSSPSGNDFILLLVMGTFPVLVVSLLYGHPSVLWLLILTGAYLTHTQKKHFISGLILSFLLLKPNLYLVAGFIFLIALEWRIMLGMFAGGVFLVFISGFGNGFELWKEYIPVLTSYVSYIDLENVMYRQFSTKALFQNIYSQGLAGKILGYTGTLWGVFALVLPGIYKWRSKKNFDLDRFWFMLPIALVLGNPHVYAYDLIVLLIPLVILTQYLWEHKLGSVRLMVLYSIMFMFFIGMSYLSVYTRFQPTIILLWWLLLKVVYTGLAPKANLLLKYLRRIPGNQKLENWLNSIE